MSHELLSIVKVSLATACAFIGTCFPGMATLAHVEIPLIIMQSVQLFAWAAAILIAIATYNEKQGKDGFKKLFGYGWRLSVLVVLWFMIYKLYIMK